MSANSDLVYAGLPFTSAHQGNGGVVPRLYSHVSLAPKKSAYDC
jgi:hypothetical protein